MHRNGKIKELGASGFLQRRMKEMLQAPPEGADGWYATAMSLMTVHLVQGKGLFIGWCWRSSYGCNANTFRIARSVRMIEGASKIAMPRLGPR